MLGFIFVVGGHNGVSHLSSIERYDPHQNQWTVCRPMKEPRTGRGMRRSAGSGVPLGVSFWVTWEKLQEVRVAGTCLQSLVLHLCVGPKVTPSVLWKNKYLVVKHNVRMKSGLLLLTLSCTRSIVKCFCSVLFFPLSEFQQSCGCCFIVSALMLRLSRASSLLPAWGVLLCLLERLREESEGRLTSEHRGALRFL